MRPHPFLAALAASITLVPLAIAQDGLGAGDPQTPTLGADAFRAPIHRGPQNRLGYGGDYGLWASGDTFKASFHGPFTYYPVLGTDFPHNLPVGWHTLSVRAGSTELIHGAPRDSFTDWRFERRLGDVVERYDVLHDGVEQSFVVEVLPEGFEGDLVVLGGLETPLHLPSGEQAADAQRAIPFTDDRGREIVRYGEAIAFDAAGRRTAVHTGWRHGAVELVVPAAFVRGATLPITIDPVLTTRIVSSGGNTVASVDVARDTETNHLLVSYSRATSASDYDAWARRTNDDLTSGTNLFYDVQNRHSNRHQSVAFVGGTNEWVLAYEMTFSDVSAVILYRIDRNETNANAGRGDLVPPPNDVFETLPSVGGTPGFDNGTKVCVAFRRDVSLGGPANTSESSIHASVYDCANETFVAEDIVLHDVPGGDADAPCINRMNTGGANAPWIVVYQTHSGSNRDSWQLRARKVTPNGGWSGVTYLGDTQRRTVHNLRPKIAGSDGRYAVVWTERANTSIYHEGKGNRVLAQSLDWPDVLLAGTPGQPQPIASTTLTVYDLGYGRPIGYDRLTKSHWAVAMRHQFAGLIVTRLGYDMGVTERVTMAQVGGSLGHPTNPAICFDNDRRRFPVVWSTLGSINRVHGNHLTYPQGAYARFFGDGCRGRMVSRNAGSSPNYLGSEFFEVFVSGGLFNTPVYVLVGSHMAAQPIPLASDWGCDLLLDPGAALFVAGAGTTNAVGRFDLQLPIPSALGPTELFWQALQPAPGGFASTDGLRTPFR